jgi:hypothetical protein
MLIVLAVVVILASAMNFLRRDVAYAAVILWALIGIAVRIPQQGVVTTAIWVAAFFVVATLMIALFLVKPEEA